MYVSTGTGLLRYARMPMSQELPQAPPCADPVAWRAWIGQVWPVPGIAEAVTAASGDLARAVGEVLGDLPPAARQVLRTGTALMQYVLRARYRATPFGLFAATAPVILDGAGAQAGTAERVIVRLDARWVERLVSRLLADPGVVEGLRVVADPTCALVKGRFEIAYAQGDDRPARVQARATGPMRLVMDLARRPISVADLVERVLAARPDAARPTVVAMICQALGSGLLHSDLCPATTGGSALDHIGSRLGPGGKDATRLRRALADVDTALSADHRPGPLAPAPVSAVMNDLVGTAGDPFMYDVHRPGPIHLPPGIADDITAALAVMTTISPYPTGSSSWQDYRARFFDRYSLGVLVPLREVLDPVTGLGYPAGYRDSAYPRREAALTGRDRHLLARIQRLDRTAGHELVLDEQDLAALHVGDAVQTWATTEVTVAVHCAGPGSLQRGEWTLVLQGLSSSLGVLTGRFLPLMDPEEQERHALAHRSAPTLGQRAVRVQVCSPPLRRRVRNVTGTIRLVPEVLALGEYDEHATMFADEIAVGATAECLYLVHMPSMRRIEPFLADAVEPEATTHPLARFLVELPRAHTAVLTPFDWGAASGLPFLPRVHYGRVVLSPARWLLAREDLTSGTDPARAVADWVAREQVPATVSAGGTDARLRLDLRMPAHRRLLARMVHEAPLGVQEEPEDTEHGWFGHAAQVTLGFANDQPRLPTPAPVFGPTFVEEAGLRRPGRSRHLLLRVDAPTARTTDVFDSGLADLLDEPPVLRWWFTRYRDPEAHLRIRVALRHAEDFAVVADRVGAWSEHAHRENAASGFSWQVDRPETGRYGTGETFEAAEDVFARDSRCALAQDDPARPPTEKDALLIASLIDITAALLGDDDRALRCWDQSAGPARSWPPIDRGARAQAMTLCADLARDALARMDGGPRLASAWRQRATALRSYATSIRVQGHDPRGVLSALVHLHHARAFGIDADHEQLLHHHTRQIAHSVLLRRAAGR